MASDDGMRRRQCCGLPSGLVRWAGSGWSPGGGGWREILQALRREGWLWRYDVEYDCIRVRGMTRVTMQHNLPVDRQILSSWESADWRSGTHTEEKDEGIDCLYPTTQEAADRNDRRAV